MVKLILLLFFAPLSIEAQETYKWAEIDEVTFFDLSKLSCDVDSITSISKTVSYENLQWKNILLNTQVVASDVAKENTCYIILVKFKNREYVTFLLYPKQKAIFDTRKNHFNYLFINKNDFLKFDLLLETSKTCLNKPNCKVVN